MAETGPEIFETRESLQDKLLEVKNQLTDMRFYTEAIIEIVNDPIVILDENLRVKHATKGFYTNFGTTESDVVGNHFREIKSCPWNDEHLFEKLSRITPHNSSFLNYELNCNFPNIGERVFRVNARQFESSTDKHLILISINDITDLRKDKNELEKNQRRLEERIKVAVESADLGTWEMNTLTGKVVLDKRSCELFGSVKETLEYDEFINLLYPDDRQGTDRLVKEVVAGKHDGTYTQEYRTHFHNMDEMYWLKATGRLYLENNGKAQRFAGTVLDITNHKLDEQLLKESEERFKTASDAASVMIWLSTPDRFRNYFNKSWLKFTRRSFEQEEGNGWKESIHPDDLEKYRQAYESSFKERNEYSLEYRMRRHDGEYRWVSEVGAPRVSPEGIFEGYIGTCIDVHEQRMTKEELEKLVAERTKMLSNAVNNLETSNQNLEEFAYVASHDLQEPLRKIQSFANRLQQKNTADLTQETKLYLSKITNASNRMSRLVGDLLHYSRLKNTEGAVELTDLNEILRNVLADFDLTIQQKNAVIKLDVLPQIPAIPTRMYQLFHNLVSNSLKFAKAHTPPEIEINAKKLSEDEKLQYSSLNKDESYTLITFSDNGIGFQQEFAEKIFNVFQRLNGTNDYEGTGIGLAICRKIVLNHNGLIFADSKEDEGTLFTILLPLANDLQEINT